MTERDTTDLPLAELSARLRDGQLSPVSLVDEYLHRIEAVNPALNAFITITADLARAQAAQASSEIAAGRWRGPLHGVPVAVKDFYDTAGIRTTAAFEPFARRVPRHDAVLVSALHDARAVLVGKTNMHTLGMGTTGLESHAGPVLNPWSADHVAGGSSGGSAAAVAAGLCYATVDTDAIGSGRLPAAVCGVTCHKPTFGLLSPVGILAGEPTDPAILTLGHPCVMARTPADVTLVLQALVAASASRASIDETAQPVGRSRRVGVVTNYVGDDEVRARFSRAVRALEAMSFTLVEVEAPFAAASFDLRHVERDRTTIDVTLLADVSALVLPTLAATTPTVAEARARGPMAVSSQNTFFANYFGLPAVSVPIAHARGLLPMGVQFVGPHGSDAEVLALAADYQRVAGLADVRPLVARTTPSR